MEFLCLVRKVYLKVLSVYSDAGTRDAFFFFFTTPCSLAPFSGACPGLDTRLIIVMTFSQNPGSILMQALVPIVKDEWQNKGISCAKRGMLVLTFFWHLFITNSISYPYRGGASLGAISKQCLFIKTTVYFDYTAQTITHSCQEFPN